MTEEKQTFRVAQTAQALIHELLSRREEIESVLAAEDAPTDPAVVAQLRGTASMLHALAIPHLAATRQRQQMVVPSAVLNGMKP